MNPGIAAILLAAGRSVRMGSCKQLLPLGESTVIGRCLDTLQRGGIGDIVVVVSECGSEVAAAARKQGAKVAVNRTAGGDMASSVRTGRDAVGADVSGILIALCDCPLVLPGTVALLMRLHNLFSNGIITPSYQGKNGHPLLFARPILDELAEGMTLRDVVLNDPRRMYGVPVDDAGILMDMDTPDDYARLSGMVERQPE